MGLLDFPTTICFFKISLNHCELSPTRTPPTTPWLIPLANDMAQPSCKVIPPGKSLLRCLKSTSVLICTCCSVDLDITVSDMTKAPARGSDALAGNYNLQKDCEDNSYLTHDSLLVSHSWIHESYIWRESSAAMKVSSFGTIDTQF